METLSIGLGLGFLAILIASYLKSALEKRFSKVAETLQRMSSKRRERILKLVEDDLEWRIHQLAGRHAGQMSLGLLVASMLLVIMIVNAEGPISFYLRLAAMLTALLAVLSASVFFIQSMIATTELSLALRVKQTERKELEMKNEEKA